MVPMILRLPLLFLFSAVLFWVSCSKSSVEDDGTIIVKTPPEFNVDLFERRDDQTGEPQLGLWIESIQAYPCDQPIIEVSTAQQQQTIKVLIAGVRLPEPCSGGMQKASIFIPFGVLTAGIYDLQINVGANSLIQNIGKLQVETDKAVLQMPDARAINILNFVTNRIPDHYLWGYAAVPDEGSEPAADQFLVDLKKRSVDVALPPGYYSYFSVSGTGQVHLHSSILPQGVHEPFVRQFNGDLQPLRQIIEAARNSPDTPLPIYCQSTLGKI